MRGHPHLYLGVAGLLCLAALACLLWEPCDAPGEPVRETVMGPEPVPAALDYPASRVTTYDRGRTTIKPLISEAALARRRAA